MVSFIENGLISLDEYLQSNAEICIGYPMQNFSLDPMQNRC
jgi:hypothetical protein